MRKYNTKVEAFEAARQAANYTWQVLREGIDSRATMSTSGFTIELKAEASMPTRSGIPGSKDVKLLIVLYEVIQIQEQSQNA